MRRSGQRRPSRHRRRLAVFAGSCSLEAAEAVCADALLPQTEVRPRLESLVQHGLLRRQELADAEPRSSMLEPVRASIGLPQPASECADTEQATAAARTALGRPLWAAAFEAGRRRGLEQAVAEALATSAVLR